jgi:PAS domain S-box-containing protein
MTDESRAPAPSRAETRGETQQRALDAEERARLLIDSVRDYAIFMLDPQGIITSWNPGAERIKGYTPQEIIGQPFTRFYTREDVQRGRPQALLRAATEQGHIEDEGWRVRKDGSRFWADVIISAIRDASGKLIGFSKVTRDLTERRRAEEQLRQSEERFRLLVEGVADYAMFMIDPQGIITSWNPGAQRIKGYTPEEIIGQSFHRFYPEEEVLAGKCELELEVALREGRFEEEGWRVRKDGSRFWANVIITPLRDSTGKHIGFAKVTRDLTDRRNQEEERMRLAHAQEALRLRDEFLSIASHELKTPLTALQLQLQSLRERLEKTEPKLSDKLDRAARSGERLADLIESLLDVSRIATGRFDLNPQSFDLTDALHESLERLRESAARARCELSVTADPAIVGTWDKLRLEQVINNLLSNALKYAAGTPIHVTLRQEGDTAVLEVCDKGPGIPEAALPRIFDRFERAAAMHHYGGLGLGLYVVREIIKAHNGMVSVRNLPEGGACFTVRLPILPSPSAEKASQTEELH